MYTQADLYLECACSHSLRRRDVMCSVMVRLLGLFMGCLLVTSASVLTRLKFSVIDVINFAE